MIHLMWEKCASIGYTVGFDLGAFHKSCQPPPPPPPHLSAIVNIWLRFINNFKEYLFFTVLIIT